jgi:hypothetical protein
LHRDRRIAIPALALLLGVAAIEPWKVWLSSHGLRTSSGDYQLSSALHPLYMAHRIGRVPYSSHEILRVMFSTHRWLVVLPLALLAILAAARRLPVLAAGSAAWLLLAFAGLILVYWAGTFGFTLRDELESSGHRVSSTIVIVAGAMVPLILHLACERKREPAAELPAR